MSTTGCAQCPWRKENQGKRHQDGFYTKANLTRLWNQIRDGGKKQSCHLTDPSHPDHVKAGAPLNATAQECPGSVILILRECRKMADPNGEITDKGVARYKQERKKRGLTPRGLLYWLVGRIQLGAAPMMGEGKLPRVDENDEAIGLPSYLEEG